MATSPKAYPVMPERRISTRLLVAVVLITVASMGFRVGYVSVTAVISPLRADAHQYVVYAQNLIHHGTFSLDATSGKPVPDSYRSPGYPAFIALVMLCAGDSTYPAIQYAQAILGGLMAPMTFWLGTFFLPGWGALAASILVALSPHLVTSTSYLLTETLFGFLLLAGLLAFFEAQRKPGRGARFFAGLCLGCAYLTNEVTLVIVLGCSSVALLVTGAGIRHLFSDRRCRGILEVLIIFLVVPMAWTLRNQVHVPLEAPRGKDRLLMTLTHGSYPGFVYQDPKFKYYPYKEDPQQPAYSASFGNFVSVFSKRVRQRPLRFATWYLFEKPYYLWSWDILQGQGDIYIYPVKTSLYHQSTVAGITRSIMRFLHPVVLLLAFFSIPFLSMAYRKKVMPRDDLDRLAAVVSLLVFYTFIYTVFAPWPRYAIPLRPELYVCAFWSLAFLVSLRRSVPSTNGASVAARKS